MKITSFAFYSFLLGTLVSLPFANHASAEDYPAGDSVAGAKVFKKCKSYIFSRIKTKKGSFKAPLTKLQ